MGLKSVYSAVITCIYFVIFISVILWLTLIGLVSTIFNNILLYVLKKRYQSYKFIHIQKDLQRHIGTKVNPLISHTLLHVHGSFNTKIIKDSICDYINRSDEFGNVTNSNLKYNLINLLGFYAWDTSNSNFNIDDHAIVHSNKYKGQLINDQLIQEYVSQIASKYMPRNKPPWQIHIIPVTTTNYYILLRFHNLLLTKDGGGGIQMTDFMPQIYRPSIDVNRILSDDELFKNEIVKLNLLEKIILNFVHYIENVWNNLIKLYVKPRLKEFNGSEQHEDRGAFLIIFKLLIYIFKSLRINEALKSIIRIIEHRNLLKIFYWILNFLLFRHFMRLYKETTEIHNYYRTGYFTATNSFVSSLSFYTPYYWELFRQIITFIRLLYKCPREFGSFFDNHKGYPFKNLSLCGRKVVAWSETISLTDDKKIGSNRLLFETTLSALTAVLNDSLVISTEELRFYGEVDCSTSPYINAANCDFAYLKIPFKIYLKSINDFDFRSIIRTAQRQQFLLHIIRKYGQRFCDILPNLFTQIVCNYLHKKYPITLTVLYGLPGEMHTLWGHEIADVMHFSAPQSNTALAITIQRYDDQMKIISIADRQLEQINSAIAKRWTCEMRTQLLQN